MMRYVVALALVLGMVGMAQAGTVTLYCAAVAYDDSGNQSGYSNEVTVTAGEGLDITLQWDQPTLNEDGTPYDDPGGYKVFCGPSSGTYNQVQDIPDPLAVSYTFQPNPTRRPNPPGNLR